MSSSSSINCGQSFSSADISYKQATEGDCNIGRPGGWDKKNQMKWDAWNSVRGMFVCNLTHLTVGMSNKEAMERYVSVVKELFVGEGQNF